MNRYVFLLVGVAAIFCACSKSNDNSIPPGFSATVNGKAWKATRITLPNWLFVPQAQVGALQEKDTSLFYISTGVFMKIGQADPFINSVLSFSNSNMSNFYTSQQYPSHGSVTLTVWDTVGKRIEGIFSGVLYNQYKLKDSVRIKDGRFNLAYK